MQKGLPWNETASRRNLLTQSRGHPRDRKVLTKNLLVKKNMPWK